MKRMKMQIKLQYNLFLKQIKKEDYFVVIIAFVSYFSYPRKDKTQLTSSRLWKK